MGGWLLPLGLVCCPIGGGVDGCVWQPVGCWAYGCWPHVAGGMVGWIGGWWLSVCMVGYLLLAALHLCSLIFVLMLAL